MKQYKLLSLILALLCVLPCFVYAGFDTANGNQNTFSAETSSLFPSQSELVMLQEVLEIVALDKDDLNLENVDFSKLYIGSRINRYEYNESGFTLSSSYSYPIIYNNKIVLFATAAYENSRFEISTYEAELLEESNLASCAFIYDADGFYLFDGRHFIPVEYNEQRVDNRESLKDSTLCRANTPIDSTEYNFETSCITTSVIANSIALPYQNTQNNSRAHITGDYYACTVDFISQTSEQNCWAACVAMVVNFMHNLNETCTSIANAYPQYATNGATRSQVATLLQNDFDLGGYRSSEPGLTDETILTNIDNDYPIIGDFNVVTGNHHAVVIDVIHTSANYIRLCDPKTGRKYVYRSSDESHPNYYGKYTYVCSVSNNTLYMVGQVSRFLD